MISKIGSCSFNGKILLNGYLNGGKKLTDVSVDTDKVKEIIFVPWSDVRNSTIIKTSDNSLKVLHYGNGDVDYNKICLAYLVASKRPDITVDLSMNTIA